MRRGGEGGVDHMISEKQKPMPGERNGGGGHRGEGGGRVLGWCMAS